MSRNGKRLKPYNKIKEEYIIKLELHLKKIDELRIIERQEKSM
jgi:hypothetical protein